MYILNAIYKDLRVLFERARKEGTFFFSFFFFNERLLEKRSSEEIRTRTRTHVGVGGGEGNHCYATTAA